MGQSVQGTNNRRAQCRTQHRTICFCKSFNPKSLVRMRGLEPPRGCPRSHLKAVRLPISPHPRNFTTFEPPSLNCYLKVLDTVSPGVPILCSPSGMWKSVSPSIPGFPKHRCKTVSTSAAVLQCCAASARISGVGRIRRMPAASASLGSANAWVRSRMNRARSSAAKSTGAV